MKSKILAALGALSLSASSPALAVPAGMPAPAWSFPFAAVGGAAYISLATRMGWRLTPQDFGAKGDGATDDTPAFNAACSAGAHDLYLTPNTTYEVHDFSCNLSPYRLHGGNGATIQRASIGGTFDNFFMLSGAKVTITGVTFDLNAANVVTTNTDYGLRLTAGGQTIDLENNLFENADSNEYCLVIGSTASPSTGGSFVVKGNEFSACGNSAFLGATNGLVAANYIHDSAHLGINVSGWGTVSATNYASDVKISGNTLARNPIGINIGGWGTNPFNYTSPSPAINIMVDRNKIVDSLTDALELQANNVTATNNVITQSANSTMFEAIDCNVVNSRISENYIVAVGTSYGIDCGGSSAVSVENNYVSMNGGLAMNAGSAVNSDFTNNYISNPGGVGIQAKAYEADPSGNAYPFATSNTKIDGNTVSAAGGTGIVLFDNAGGTSGAKPVPVRRNHIIGATTYNAVRALGEAAGSAIIDGNDLGGGNTQYATPNGSGYEIFDLVYMGGVLSGNGSTTTINGILTTDQNTYNAGGSILSAWPTNGGSGYHAGTTALAPSAGCTWTGNPAILNGVIVGVLTTSVGTGCSSATITATDTNATPGSGAVFTTLNKPVLPAFGKLTYQNIATQIITVGSGYLGGLNPGPSMLTQANSQIQLQAEVDGQYWNVLSFRVPSFASTALPTCSGTDNNARIIITGSSSGKWAAKCNGTSWIYDDGTTAP